MELPIPPKSPTLSHLGSKKSLRTIRTARSSHSLKSMKSTRSNTSIRVFNHGHKTYRTCFNYVHVKTASCVIGLVSLLMVCSTLVYCLFTSQELQRPVLKLYALPMIFIILILLYMYVGIIQKKAKLLYPFIALEIFFVFATAISIVMITIAVVCRTKFILQLFVFVETNASEEEYIRASLATASVLLFHLFLQIWALRAVCGCFRYFIDLNRYNIRHNQMNYI